MYNFSAGPAVLPEEVLREAADEMLDYRGCGMSVMEMSHRSKPFAAIMEAAEQDIRDLMDIPDNYRVLFLQGGASTQFAMIPMNLMKNKVADYIVSGSWSKKAFKEAKIFGDARCVASSEDENFSYVPDVRALQLSDDATTSTSARTRPSTAPCTTSCPTRTENRWWPTCRRASCPSPWTCRSTAHLRRRSEERGPGRRDYRHHPRRPRVRAFARHAHHAALRHACRREEPVQHPACVRHLHVRQGVPVAEGPGRSRP